MRLAPGTKLGPCETVAPLGAGGMDVVAQRVLEPAGMSATAVPSSDQLPGTAALGYVPAPDGGWRTNLLHLPVRGEGGGGA